MTLSINDTVKDTPQNNTSILLSFMSFIAILNVVMLSVVMLSVEGPSLSTLCLSLHVEMFFWLLWLGSYYP
jgi:hypothetical protein